MNTVEKYGETVEAAMQTALEELNATKDEVTVEILEKPRKGVLGIGKKRALVKVELTSKMV
ncbi:Jag N-terminal domain-containing protein [Terrilactibacillus laevilacticus]|uniref:Jag N-terminal domain-containing protein n=1 Tax=Terrilactibacillus laevilacticus TaxID=1380157 RepID=A0ABW5PNZ4_9BACI|nr:Jag N-terminal domain-containing protein [Terrilactibacillus laevilacticus]